MIKKLKDGLVKLIAGSNYVPEEVLEAYDYFLHFGPINFHYTKDKDCIIAVSTNFKWGTIITSGKNPSELDRNIKDAIITSFSVPSAYSKKLDIKKVDKEKKEYALA